MIALIDYNMGNLRSVINLFEKINTKIEVIKDPDQLKNFDKVILPGVGAYKDAMENLNSNGMKESILEFSKSGKPLLGICLGMQLLLDSSEEFGFTQGLGLIPGIVKEFDKSKFDHKLKVPHMGWNELFVERDSKLFEGMSKEIYLYFVHSFHATCKDEYVIGKTFYGYDFASAIEKDNIYGVQPHPEKSHDNGLKILQNFTKI
ncbi:imidazole glycerol phosphate synthase subunit HisH [Sulfurospirillum arcachonense]|uniref:imidazole glycerol phosphate synthase subunit HisH n=1 Tax=Sulfurospirillum arcachonense TaxID=57666 RepID=UPI00046852BB|nr:imidazole glycerol phosphate synthase subunit HisH [Sulfurospirillum arcachonense]